MKFDPYLCDALMRDLVGHGRSAAAFLVYFQLYRHTLGDGRESYPVSYLMLAEATGLSKRSVQVAIGVLERRQLIRVSKARPTAIPVYSVLTPWKRLERNQVS